jgi:hypothetical protein
MRIGRFEKKIPPNPIRIPIMRRLPQIMRLVHVRHRPRALQGEEGKNHEDFAEGKPSINPACFIHKITYVFKKIPL